jgi:hypothetical protein
LIPYQLHIVIPDSEVFCLLITCYHQSVHWKFPWLSLVYIISGISHIDYSLRIRTPPLKNANSLLADICLLCSQSRQHVSSGKLDVLLRQPWPSFCQSVAAVHLQHSLAWVLVISLTAVQTLSVWQVMDSMTLDFINLLPTLCSHTGEGFYQLKITISYKHSHELLFTLSQHYQVENTYFPWSVRKVGDYCLLVSGTQNKKKKSCLSCLSFAYLRGLWMNLCHVN